MRSLQRGAVAALLVTTALAAAACGGGGGSAATTGTTAATTSTSAAGAATGANSAAFAKYAACLKQNGVTLPTFGARRPPGGGAGGGQGNAPTGTAAAPPTGTNAQGGQGRPRFATSARFQKAAAACAKLRPTSFRGGGFRGGRNGPSSRRVRRVPQLPHAARREAVRAARRRGCPDRQGAEGDDGLREPPAVAAGADLDHGSADHHVMRTRSITRRSAGLYGTLIAAIGVAGWFAFGTIYGSSSASASGVARTVTVSRGTVESSVSASGNISTAESASPAFATSGTLTALTVSVGSQVKKGQVLGRISATDAKSTLASARATLATDQATLATANAGGTTSQRAQTASSLSSAKLQLTSAQQTLATNEATLAAAKKQLAVDQRLGCPAASSSSGTGVRSERRSSASRIVDAEFERHDHDAERDDALPSGGTRTHAVGQRHQPPRSRRPDRRAPSRPRAVTLTATVNPGGSATTYFFQYGLKASYGSTTARQAPEAARPRARSTPRSTG